MMMPAMFFRQPISAPHTKTTEQTSSGTRPRTEKIKELGLLTLNHSVPPISSFHFPHPLLSLSSDLLHVYLFRYHIHPLYHMQPLPHRIHPPLISGQDQNNSDQAVPHNKL